MANDKSFKIKNGLSAGRYLDTNGADGASSEGPSDTFNTDLYTGNDGTQTITNNVDLSTDGGLVWIKNRNNTGAHLLWSTEYTGNLNSTNTDALNNTSLTPTFNTDGFTIGPSNWTSLNNSARTYVAWTFKQASSFFDVVTYTGNGSSGRTVSHSLGSVPGCIVIKRTSSSEDWVVYHVGADATSPEDYYFKLNTTAARIDSAAAFNDTAPTSTNFTVGNNGDVNANGETYVAYLFAHDTSDDGYIQCGSYTGTGAAGNAVNVGFQPQWLLIKQTDGANGWFIWDSKRGSDELNTGNDATLSPHTSNAEATGADYLDFTSTGFTLNLTGGAANGSNKNYIYVAIRGISYNYDMDLSTGTYFSMTPSGNTTFTISNPPASGKAIGFTLEVNGDGSTLTWPSSIKWHEGTTPTATASKELYTFITTDGGTTYYGKKAAGDIA